MVEKVGKGVMVRGWEVGMGRLGREGKENVISWIEIGGGKGGEGRGFVGEVWMLFENEVMGGKGRRKMNGENLKGLGCLK